ncbi:hypothetical protein MTBBW1_1270007 [Desulfamplus magnetovallimortis]|uniref:Uncharacterized protein n=1 Tax=Desulfamplus magnetovallimortis TaxID=1246637 RepID=A0A1W1H6S0_9BACT|nr:hypothetical protein MTBBW1_1270007 [Desulfamplus magnetovallimortis]
MIRNHARLIILILKSLSWFKIFPTTLEPIPAIHKPVYIIITPPQPDMLSGIPLKNNSKYSILKNHFVIDFF